eukprot:scaffold269320_cov18-Tisochrysis_lutea.AAC.1
MFSGSSSSAALCWKGHTIHICSNAFFLTCAGHPAAVRVGATLDAQQACRDTCGGQQGINCLCWCGGQEDAGEGAAAR